MNIRISADSTADLSPELLEKYNIATMPLHVSLGENDYLDGVTITPEDIYKYYEDTKKLPKSGARSAEEYKEYFEHLLSDGYDAVVHFCISADMSVSYANAESAAKELSVKHGYRSVGVGRLRYGGARTFRAGNIRSRHSSSQRIQVLLYRGHVGISLQGRQMFRVGISRRQSAVDKALS